jgi:hypothetical protein
MVGTTTRCSWQRTSSQIEIQTSPDKGRTAASKVRNEPCACGSGKKYKRCCGGATVDWKRWRIDVERPVPGVDSAPSQRQLSQKVYPSLHPSSFFPACIYKYLAVS